jgi:hypothetical protein
MAAENKKITITSSIVADEHQLNSLFQEALSGVRDDINEAQQNIELYMDAILHSDGGKEMYGTLYNDALKIKGQARDKQLKFLDMFKDRVTKKEILQNNTKKESEVPFDHMELNRLVDDINQGKKMEAIRPIVEAKKEEFYRSEEDNELFDDEDTEISLEGEDEDLY